jgi:LmbE family N-acetylglucosaminyl deacetylase
MSLVGIQAFLNRDQLDSSRRLVCVGGHPDDPESGCGGTLCLASKAGHAVSVIYLTRGEAGIPGIAHEEAARIRTAEAEAACRIIGAKPVFAGQVDGDTKVDKHWVSRMQALIETEKPDMILTHWPVDSHMDHQCASLLTIQAWMRSGKKIPLYFFEVCQGAQTRLFHPTDYVDITAAREQKRQAVYCHTSQNPPGIYEADDCNHEMMERFRGIEAGVQYAEGFVRCTGVTSGLFG